MGKKKGILLVIAGMIAFVALFFLFLYVKNRPVRNMLLANNTNKYNISHYDAKELKDNLRKTGNFDPSQTAALDFSYVWEAQTDRELSVVGEVAIPELKVNLPIFLGISNTAIATGAGTMKPNEVMGKGNYALASHNLIGGAPKLLFSPLIKARNGMMIYLTDKTNIFQYKIYKIETVSPNDGYVIDDFGGDEVTLVLCSDESGTARRVVQGILEKSENYATAPVALRQSFEVKYSLW